MANYSIEIERNNVTLAQFLRYVRQQCERKGIDFGIERESFEKPLSESSYGYTVINGEKKCHSAEYRVVTHLRRKLASYETQKGFIHYYYTDELEEYQKTELCHYDWTEPGPTHHAGRKLVRPFLMTSTPISSTLTVPCITRFASLPLMTRKPDMAITIKPIEMLNNSPAPLRRGLSCPQ